MDNLDSSTKSTVYQRVSVKSYLPGAAGFYAKVLSVNHIYDTLYEEISQVGF